MEDSNSRIVKIKSSEISLGWLDKYPIWTWYESELVEDENYICPLSTSISDGFSDIFVRALFLTPSNETIKGYIMCDIDTQEIYTISLFWEEEEYVFNKYASDYAEKEYKKLVQEAGSCFNPLFPIQYQCDEKLQDVFEVKGSFDPLKL
jgi:hypothetical protein